MKIFHYLNQPQYIEAVYVIYSDPYNTEAKWRCAEKLRNPNIYWSLMPENLGGPWNDIATAPSCRRVIQKFKSKYCNKNNIIFRVPKNIQGKYFTINGAYSCYIFIRVTKNEIKI